MNEIELNAILFYADFLSLQEISIPVTNNCKYYFIHKTPIHISYVAGLTPLYDINNPYFKQAQTEYLLIRDKFDDEGVISFISNIASIGASGCVDAIRMLKCIHQYSDKQERKSAFNKYHTWKNNQKFTHIIKDEDGNPKEVECSRYVYDHERMLLERGLLKCIKLNPQTT